MYNYYKTSIKIEIEFKRKKQMGSKGQRLTMNSDVLKYITALVTFPVSDQSQGKK